jgi:hypothetical protein
MVFVVTKVSFFFTRSQGILCYYKGDMIFIVAKVSAVPSFLFCACHTPAQYGMFVEVSVHLSVHLP